MSLENSSSRSWTQTAWNTLCVPPLAAAIAYGAVADFFFKKTALQKQVASPQIDFALRRKIGVIAGGVVGAQMGLVIGVEAIKNKITGKNEAQSASLPEKLFYGFVVGIVSAHPLAVLNGCTSGLTFQQSLRVKPKEALAIALREVPFVASQAAIDPMKSLGRSVFGESRAIELFIVLCTGGVGAFLGHVPDTYSIRVQAKLPFHFKRNGWLGLTPRLIGVMLFSLLYDINKKGLQQ